MKKIQNKLFILFIIFSIITSSISALLFFHGAYDRVYQDIRHRLKNIAALAAISIDGDIHEKLTNPEQENTADYLVIKKQLSEIKKTIPDIYCIYTMRPLSKSQISFVVDEESKPELIAHLGQIYDNPGKILKERAEILDSAVTESDFYTDKWGTWLSGYAPIYNKKGIKTGIIGIDISAKTVIEYKKKILYISLMVFFITLPIFILLGLFLGKKIAKPIVLMKNAVEEISQGKFETRIHLRSNDELGYLANSFNEMTEKLKISQDQLSQALKKYRNIFDNAMDGIFQTTADGKLLTANSALIKMLGYENQDDLFLSLTDIKNQLYAQPSDRDIFLTELKKSNKIFYFETRLKRKDGSLIWVEINARLIKDDPKDVIIEGIIHDITSRKERDSAEKERKAAEAASQAKSEFLANMSHEIRTPLNAVMGMTDLLSRTEMTNKQQDYLKKIKISSKTLLAVINDILDFSKIEAGRMELEAVNFSLYEVMANLTELFAQRAHEKEVELMISIDKNVPNALVGDPIRVGQILINLTNNAIKFTSQGEVVITVKETKKINNEKSLLEFSVKDTGIGIKKERLDTIFDSFTQEDTSTTRKYGGTGLGLSICKKLTDLMGGEIKVESVHGQGSSFTFTAIFKRQAEDKQIKLKPPMDMRGLKVLIVDDNATSREILSQTIESFQMNAVTVEDGEKAIDLIQNGKETFDLILMDWKLPSINGLEASKQIKTGYKGEKTPIIFMVSAYAREDLLQEGEKSFIDAFLHKPVNQSFLFDTIIELFSKDPDKLHKSIVAGKIATVANHEWFKGTKVLLVEDNKINQEIAVEWLESVGMIIDTAATGKEALIKADQKHYDLILMDIQLPEMDGYTATKEIRKKRKFINLPIIAMTAHALKGDKEKCLAAGMNDYITKPIDPQEMFKTIGKWIASENIGTETAFSEGLESFTTSFSLPGINTASGLYRSNNNMRLYRKLLNVFREDYRNTESRMLILYNSNTEKDWQEARRIAHSFKGVGANLGAETLSMKAADLETEIQSGHGDYHSKTSKDFFLELNKIIKVLDHEFEKYDDKITPDALHEAHILSKEEAQQKLKEIIHLLDEDLEEAEKIMEENIHALKLTFTEDHLRETLISIENFDIDRAKELIQKYI